MPDDLQNAKGRQISVLFVIAVDWLVILLSSALFLLQSPELLLLIQGIAVLLLNIGLFKRKKWSYWGHIIVGIVALVGIDFMSLPWLLVLLISLIPSYRSYFYK